MPAESEVPAINQHHAGFSTPSGSGVMQMSDVTYLAGASEPGCYGFTLVERCGPGTVIESMSESAAGMASGNGRTPDGIGEQEDPSRSELWDVVQDQQRTIDQMRDQIAELEAKVDDVEFEAESVERVAEQLASGKIAGDVGADFIQDFMEVPDHSTLIDAKATKLFLKIIRERLVAAPVTTSRVVKWFGLHDSSNPSVQAKRIMDRVDENRGSGFYIGSVELGKHRGQNAIWIDG